MNNLSYFWLVTLAILGAINSSKADLELNFYAKSCPNAEKIVLDYIHEHIPNAPSLAATFIRMHFHDCFVRGCDASILLNFTSSSGNQTEKTAVPNQTLRGFGFIDKVKSLVEAECPGVVSCADVLSLVARDSIVATGGPYWKVPTGRRDGSISNASEALANIPAPNFNFSALQSSFANKSLDLKDLVLLSGNWHDIVRQLALHGQAIGMTFPPLDRALGAHTIGVSHCPSFDTRLYNFSGVLGTQDPALDSEYAENLKKNKCKFLNDTKTLSEMDPGSFRTFDLSYYNLLLKRRGLFQSDAALTTNSVTLSYINQLLQGSLRSFFDEFSLSMEKMGRIGVLTGSAGEIRKTCAFVNS